MLNLYNLNNKNGKPWIPGQARNDNFVIPAKAGIQGSKKPDFKKYVDPSGDLSSQQLKWSLWFSAHRLLLYRLLVGALAVLVAGFWLYSGLKWVVFLVELPGADSVQKSLTRFPNYDLINPRFAIEPVQIYGAEFMPGGVDKYDAVAEMFNPNMRSTVSFDYFFAYSGTTTARQTAVLLPGERRPLAAMGLGAEVLGGTPDLVLENIFWRRISAKSVPNAEEWQKYRLNFAVTDFKFVLPSAGGADFPAVQFKYSNNSPYSYKSAGFTVGLYSGDELVGVLPLRFDTFTSGEIKDVDLRVFAPGVNVSDVIVYPLINAYDEEAYL